MSPIRSNRGRAAVWRHLWSWPLQTRTRAVLTLVAVTAVLLLVGQLGNLTDRDQAAPAETGTTTPVPTTETTEPSAPAETSETPRPAPSTVRAAGKQAPQGALRTAMGFMRNWVHTDDRDTDEWVHTLQPYAMPELAGQLQSVDPARVPSSEIVGDPRVTRASPSVVEVNIPTDTDTVSVVLIHPNGPWKVTDVGVA